MKKKIISVLSVLVCLCMVCALNPITSLAAEVTNYGLWVGGVEVTSENEDNITGPGINCGEGGKASYDPTSKTLTLNNVNITGVHSFHNAMGKDSAGIYYKADNSDASLNIDLIGKNSICVELATSDLSCYGIFVSCYGIFDDDYSQGLKITGNGSLTVQSGDAISGNRYTSWSVGIFSYDKIIVGADCTITATSGTADISAAIYSYNRLTATNSKVTAGDSADSANAVDITSDDFDLGNYKYMKIEPASVQAEHTHNLTPVSENPATCTTAGNIAYYTCDGCGKWFSDASGTTEITDHSSVVIKSKHNPVLVKAEDATAAKEGNIKYYHCENCGKDYYDEAGIKEIATKEAIVIKKLAPKIIDGNNAKIDKSSKEPVSFRSDAAFADFIRVEVDGKELVKDKDYTLKEGSIIASLTPEFAATLTAGEHTLGIVSLSGTALTSFTITDDNASSDNSTDNTEKSPQTGDNGNIIFWSFISGISLAALCTTAIVSKKKKQSR